ncbi:MAG: hypothetical protein ACTSXL_04890 [Alphaproteobacteria bacterium]|nr:MAG: hypothetical protein B6I23_00295 [Rickettsiaceae bacterium 4572_127]
MKLLPATFGRMFAIQEILVITENQNSESLSKIFKDSFSHDMKVDNNLKNKILLHYKKHKEELEKTFENYEIKKSSNLFKSFFYSMKIESEFLKKEIAIIWSEYKKLAELFFHEKEINALKAILNNSC